MPAYVLMKVFENAPARYEGAIEALTLGRIRPLKEEIARQVGPGSRALDLGCGTGSLAAMMARRGARVLAVDTSGGMLETARRRLAEEALEERVELRRLSVMEIDALAPRSFDFVVSTLVLSELSDAEVAFVLAAARQLLAPGGRLLVGDEVALKGGWKRLGFKLVRFPFELLTYLIGEGQKIVAGSRLVRALYFAIELPLMLLVFFCVPPTSRPLANLEGRIRAAGFRTEQVWRYLGGSLELVCASAP